MNPELTAHLYSWLIARVEEQNARELSEQLELELQNKVEDLPWKEAVEIFDLKKKLEERILMSTDREERMALIAQFRQELINVAREVFHDAWRNG